MMNGRKEDREKVRGGIHRTLMSVLIAKVSDFSLAEDSIWLLLTLTNVNTCVESNY